jgi:hypothetical protein
MTARADELFELTDAVLCADGPVTSRVELTMVAEHRRGHGAMYDALTCRRPGDRSHLLPPSPPAHPNPADLATAAHPAPATITAPDENE